MKNTAISIIFLLIFLAVSCGDSKENSIKAGAACSSEWEKSCSSDGSAILLCKDSSWQAEKLCYLYLDQYCRQMENGEFSCTDSLPPSDSSDPANDQNSTNDSENSETDNDSEQNDDDNSSDSGNSDSDESGSTDNGGDSNGDSSDDSDSDDNGSPDSDSNEDDAEELETCADILKCKKDCSSGDSACSKTCHSRGTTLAQNNHYNWQECLQEYNINEILTNENCKNAMIECGEVGDMSYNIPYGHAVLQTPAPITAEKSSGSFITGTFGNSNSTEIVDSSQNTVAYAEYVEYKDEETGKTVKYISINQSSQGNDTYTHEVTLKISASESGTYTVGILENDPVTLLISEPETINGEKKVKCYHAFGYGSINISSISSSDNTTVSIDTSEIDLYSFKNAPMYENKDLSGTWKTCNPQ